MKKVLIVKNITRESDGILKNVLEDFGIGYHHVDLHQGESLPDPKDYAAVFIFGGPNSANDETPRMQQEITFIKKILELKVPYLGICLGMQALAKAAGGKVHPHTMKEIGFRGPDGFFYLEPTGYGIEEGLFKGMKGPIKTFQLHGETVDLEPHFKLLATGNYCPIQSIKVGENAYGVQFHLELTKVLLEDCMNNDPDLSKLDKDTLLKDFEALKEQHQAAGKLLFTNFLKKADLIEPELRPEFIAKMKHIEKQKSIKVDDFAKRHGVK